MKMSIEFTRFGWKQLARLNRSLGLRCICPFVLKRELSDYIASVKASGRELDMTCQELRYEGGVYVLLRRTQGVWFVTDVFAVDAPAVFSPLYFWQRVRRGLRDLLIHVLIGWRDAAARGINLPILQGG